MSLELKELFEPYHVCQVQEIVAVISPFKLQKNAQKNELFSVFCANVDSFSLKWVAIPATM